MKWPPQWSTLLKRWVPCQFGAIGMEASRFVRTVNCITSRIPRRGGGRRLRQLAEPEPVPLVVVTGLVRDERVEIRSVLRLDTGPTPVGRRLKGTSAELLDEHGEVIERAPLRWMSTQASCGCGCVARGL